MLSGLRNKQLVTDILSNSNHKVDMYASCLYNKIKLMNDSGLNYVNILLFDVGKSGCFS